MLGSQGGFGEVSTGLVVPRAWCWGLFYREQSNTMTAIRAFSHTRLANLPPGSTMNQLVLIFSYRSGGSR